MSGNSTYMAKNEEVDKKWYVIDATDKPMGRVAVKVARILMGKHKPTYTAHVDTGDFVVLLNAEKIKLTGNKLTQGKVYKHSGYPGGLKVKSYAEMLQRSPSRFIEMVIKGMLPHTKLGRHMLKKLKVYDGNSHPHAAQKPEPLELGL